MDGGRSAAASARAILVQIYCASADLSAVQQITQQITQHYPHASIVGATTVGELIEGRMLTNSTVIGFTYFEESTVSVVSVACEGQDALECGIALGQQVNAIGGSVAGVLLLATPLSLDAASLLNGLASTAHPYPVFGGGAGDYASMQQSLIFTHQHHSVCGAIAIVLLGETLRIETQTYLGWRPLSKPMRVTNTRGLVVETVDHHPAFEVYQRYLNIANDDNFFLNALEFPFLLERAGELMARVPIATTPQGGLLFVADVEEGEAFRLGYGDPDLIIHDASNIHQVMTDFSPQAIFLYTCGCRRFLMQNDVDLETIPFEQIAPTFGFYTYGEFLLEDNLKLLNSTMVAVGLREGPANKPVVEAVTETNQILPTSTDPYAYKHTRIVTRLMRFIDTVTAELEASNREITELSRLDHLTKLANRSRLDELLEENLQLSKRYGTPFSLIMMDLDHFKQVNDRHGHLVGDEILIQTANLLIANTRSVDWVGRWGGEEFMIITPSTKHDEATLLAEKLRMAIATHNYPIVGQQTGSFGITTVSPTDNILTLIHRADSALYAAKQAGRNRSQAL